MRLGHDGFHVHLQRALALARNRDRHDALTAAILQLLGRSEEQEPGRTLLERSEAFPDHGGLRACAAQPAPDPAVGGDQRGRAFLARGRGPPPHHGGQDERLSALRQLSSELEDLGSHVFFEPPAAWIASHTLADVSGMSMLRTPSGHSASMTAFTNAAGEPTVADSPTPFAPMGWCGDGVTVSPSSNLGVTQAVGNR